MSTDPSNHTSFIAEETTQPRLWIKRLAIFESHQNIATPIRDITFRRGLNIIWGVELSDDAGADSAHPVTLSGHSVGKTTLCRLIRYCLGESTFGNQGAASRIRGAFPQGLVGMQLEVEGQDWAVLKPIGQAGDSRATAGCLIEDLLKLDRKENHFSDYMNHLRKSMMSSLRAETPPNSDRPFEWKHLLAWLTRDQEARFQGLHDWRSSRSDSDALQFKNPKEDPLYLIRQILGLVGGQEHETARSLELAKRDHEKVKKRISELKQEPEYRLNEQEIILRDLLGNTRRELVAEEAQGDNGLFSLDHQVNERRMELESEVDCLSNDIEEIIKAEIRLRTHIDGEEDELRRICAELEVELGATEDPANGEAPKELEEHEKRLEDMCRFGQVKYSKCKYFQNRLMELQNKIVNLSEERQQAFIQSGSEERMRFIENLEGKQFAQSQDMQSWRAQLTSYTNRRIELEAKRNLAMVSVQQLDYHVDQRKQALDLIKGRMPNTELNRETGRAEELRWKIETFENELKQLQTTYEDRLTTIRSIYDELIKKALSESYSEDLRMPKGELQFKIREATGLSGEAVETLALVLADVAAMECSCKGIGYHPRFLLHDSPREADLDRHIYNRYLLSMWTLTEEHGGQNAAPFQYIVTTTSRPPDDLKPAIRLQLEAHPASKMLFGCLLKNVDTSTPDLFDDGD